MRFALLIFMLAAGCQSETEGFALLCSGAERCVDCRGKTVDAAQTALWTWLDENVKNRSARGALESLAADANPSGEPLRAAAGDAQVHPCRLADHLEDAEAMHRMWGSTDVDDAF